MVATGSCYRSLLILSGIQCDANGKTGRAYIQVPPSLPSTLHRSRSRSLSRLRNLSRWKPPSLETSLVLSHINMHARRQLKSTHTTRRGGFRACRKTTRIIAATQTYATPGVLTVFDYVCHV